MEPTEGKTVLRVAGKELTVVLTPYQVNKFNSGVSSVYTNQNLVGVGLGYSTLKELGDKPPDVYTISYGTQFSMVDSTEARAEARVDIRKKVKYTGPKEKLFCPQMRVVIMKQPGGGASEKGTYITACYDQDRVVFVNDNGKCLYAFRNHLIIPDHPEEPMATTTAV